MNKNALAIFIKNPILGSAKTRIAKDSSDRNALDIYQQLLSITKNITQNVDCKKYLFYNQFIDLNDDWSENHFHKKLQRGEDLGEKMFQAIKLLSTEGNSKILLIGSDCPYISPNLINKAFRILEERDFVLGPTYDGGYYLIGMKKPFKSVFSEIEWSQETVFQRTIQRINSIGKTFELLTTLQDIDHLEDWENYLSTFN